MLIGSKRLSLVPGGLFSAEVMSSVSAFFWSVLLSTTSVIDHIIYEINSHGSFFVFFYCLLPFPNSSERESVLECRIL